MLKQSLIYLLLTILIVIFSNALHHVVLYITWSYKEIYAFILPYFHPNTQGQFIIRLILFIIIPLILTSIPAFLYKLICRKDFPYFMELLWGTWTILTLSILLT